LGHRNQWKTIWACESKQNKRRWIHEFIHDKDDRCIFTDIVELAGQPTCHVHKAKTCMVGLGHIGIAGFSCKSLSKYNTAYLKGKNKQCLTEGKDSSGETFAGVLNVAERYEPPVFLLENVEDLVLVSSDNRQAIMEALSAERHALFGALQDQVETF
jgi:site-specific DNA-cytosine methylase